MGKKKEQPNFSKNQEAAKMLGGDLSKLNTQALHGSTASDEMLSLIVSEAIKGVDIPKRYPTFYRRLLSEPDLRQAFLDLLEIIDDENKSTPFLKTIPTDLDFLSQRSPEPKLKKLNHNKWLISWRQTVEQLQAIFSPPALASRKVLSLLDDHWFVLLREEIAIEGSLYTIDLESVFAEERNEALSTFLNLAVTLETGNNLSNFPIKATLKWGSYQSSLLITREGRSRFPDIPFASIFDSKLKMVTSELDFSLEIAE